MADWNGEPFLRLLFSAERFNELAIFFGSFDLNMPDFRSNASLVSITWCDHFFFGAVFLLAVFFFAAVVRFFFFAAVAIKSFSQPMQPRYQPTAL